jgi:hypothetical protein
MQASLADFSRYDSIGSSWIERSVCSNLLAAVVRPIKADSVLVSRIAEIVGSSSCSFEFVRSLPTFDLCEVDVG